MQSEPDPKNLENDQDIDFSKQNEIPNQTHSPIMSQSHSSKSPSHSSHIHSSHSPSSEQKENSKPSLTTEDKDNQMPNENSKLIKSTSSNYPQLDFLIFLSTTIQHFLETKGILTKIETQIGDIKLLFDSSFTIPDYNGCLLKIKGPTIKKKRDAAQQLLEFIVQNDIDQPGSETKKYENIEIVIMIPNGLVSMVIGTRGKQISNLIKESKASIVINQPIYKMNYRTVSISGKPANVSNAIMNIQKIMEDRYNEVATIEFECRPLNVTRTRTSVKLIFDSDVIESISGKKHSLVDVLQEEFDINVKIYKDRKNKQLERKDYILSLKGTIVNVQNAIIKITRKLKGDIRTFFAGKESYILKLLINKVFVTKLIGAGGCMIQEIANFSKGASIKIMSNKHDEKKSSCHDIPVCIAGSFSSVQDACCIIIEQMECFKNGGPVLRSGKNLHQNIASQFVNSIFTSAIHEDSEDEHIFTIKERFLSNKDSSHSEHQSPEIPYQEAKIVTKSSKKSISHHHRKKSRSFSKSNSFQKSHSHNRSRNVSRSRSRSKHRKEESGRYKKREREVSKRSPFEKNTSTFSFEEEGEMKIHTDFIIPDHLVNLLIGKNGENLRELMSKSGAKINFSQEYNDDSKLNTANGVGRLCNLKGTPKQNALAMQMILELVIKFENIFDGVGKEK